MPRHRDPVWGADLSGFLPHLTIAVRLRNDGADRLAQIHGSMQRGSRLAAVPAQIVTDETIPPDVLAGIIRTAAESWLDHDAYDAIVASEETKALAERIHPLQKDAGDAS
jgi:hypothetical protein